MLPDDKQDNSNREPSSQTKSTDKRGTFTRLIDEQDSSAPTQPSTNRIWPWAILLLLSLVGGALGIPFLTGDISAIADTTLNQILGFSILAVSGIAFTVSSVKMTRACCQKNKEIITDDHDIENPAPRTKSSSKAFQANQANRNAQKKEKGKPNLASNNTETKRLLDANKDEDKPEDKQELQQSKVPATHKRKKTVTFEDEQKALETALTEVATNEQNSSVPMAPPLITSIPMAPPMAPSSTIQTASTTPPLAPSLTPSLPQTPSAPMAPPAPKPTLFSNNHSANRSGLLAQIQAGHTLRKVEKPTEKKNEVIETGNVSMPAANSSTANSTGNSASLPTMDLGTITASKSKLKKVNQSKNNAVKETTASLFPKLNPANNRPKDPSSSINNSASANSSNPFGVTLRKTSVTAPPTTTNTNNENTDTSKKSYPK